MPSFDPVEFRATSHQTLTVSNTAVGLTLPTDGSVVEGAEITFKNATVRWRIDGDPNAPTASDGKASGPGTDFETIRIFDHEDLSSIRFIREGSVDAQLDIVYFRSRTGS